ncbi:hypothetical protein [Prosthecobacter dejongeii]|uniref:Putative membrane protein n=1 Tax=Prosthecobacter dejongeii TaxID=48465 RepID=A0A7W7YPC3_9BACT|nr:hypothetical protein [Prosthecobacter dejongeii]MBB5039896.1 putative membrane protein [Prosthecobacter dejongeii]
MSEVYVSKRWWVSPLLFTATLITATVIVCKVSDTAREVLAKAVMMVAGALATPFILESSIAIVGLVVVVAINQWRLQKEGDGWVYLAKTEPDAALDFKARLAIAEGYLELGLAKEALDHLNMLSAEEQKNPQVKAVRQRAEKL